MNCRKTQLNAGSVRHLLTTVLSLLVLTILGSPFAQPQTYQILHAFTGGADGSGPAGGTTIDRDGNLYGATQSGGTHFDGGQGVVFKMTNHSGSWVVAPIFTFGLRDDGDNPFNGVFFAPNGVLYGTTSNGGTVFTLTPSPTTPPAVFAPWGIDFLYDFPGHPQEPVGDPVFDSAGNIYGVTATGGGDGCFNREGCGIVFELTPSRGGVWTETTLYTFQGGADGAIPEGVTFDSAGDLIGTTYQGGANDFGVVFKLTPSENGWTESVLYNFTGSGGGYSPGAGLISDAYGNFYGSTTNGIYNSGTIFELSPSNGAWTYTVLAQIPGQYKGGPWAPLTMDAAGNLYGTIVDISDLNPGAVFKLTRNSHGDWTFASLHDFNHADGDSPYSTVAIGTDGNLYGTTLYGGPNGCGVVWEITP